MTTIGINRLHEHVNLRRLRGKKVALRLQTVTGMLLTLSGLET